MVWIVISPFINTVFENQRNKVFQNKVGIVFCKESQQGTPRGKGVKSNCRTKNVSDGHPQSICDGAFTEKVNRVFIKVFTQTTSRYIRKIHVVKSRI